MPYRAELKRPDLKGNFPCSVCGKVFCHSSSLSRHRMQAHFKSYQCTQCNQEISSNETLRSHMFRVHSISRMFMCRCCNWAFPDKTSLHTHTQSMARNNHPGDVAVLARSNTEGDPIDSGISSSGSPTLSFPGLPRAPTLPVPKLFPLAPQELLLARLKAQAQLAQQPQIPNFNAQWLSNWLANNPFAQQFQGFQFLHNQQNQQNLNIPIKCETASSEDKMSDFDEAIEINNEEAESFTSTSGNVTPSSNTGVEPGEIFKQSKEALTPELIARIGVIEHTAALSPRSGSQAEKQFVSPMFNQHSPTASDSHSSGVLEAACLENKCFNCELNLSKSAASEERARLLEARIVELQNTLGALSSQIVRHNELHQQQQQRIERPPLPFPLPFMNPEATKMKSILESLIQQQGIVQNLH
ncbi:unnamed protein product, partial [Mesorhabditis belari]|uniref:C2H2-type domain-containing protein n=1 Tax=Mesorhabditis belari TaxID=2138241 RepID=A0AAF3J3I7_9BILA